MESDVSSPPRLVVIMPALNEEATIVFGRRCGKDLVRDGENGFILDYESPEALSGLIRELWDNSSARTAVGERAAQEGRAWPPARGFQYIYRLALGLDKSAASS